MTGRRNIAAIVTLAPDEAQPVPSAKPEVTWIDPRELLVDDAYQRNLSERSVALIRRIAAGWDWRKFKAPNCAWTEDGLEIIDGQHTAIGAACRSDIAEIPVLITEAAEQADRAAAFIGLNRDRVSITATQLHAAALTAGDDEAVAIEEACKPNGITVLKSQPGAGRFKPRQTMAVAAIGALVRKHGEDGARHVLAVCAEAELAPIQANQIKAVELLLTDPEFRRSNPTTSRGPSSRSARTLNERPSCSPRRIAYRCGAPWRSSGFGRRRSAGSRAACRYWRSRRR